MNPTPSTTAPQEPPVVGGPVVEFIRSNRQNAAYLFLGLSLAFLVGTIFLAVRAFRAPTTVEKKADDTKKLDIETPPEAEKTEVANPNRSSYMIGWIGCLAAFLVAAGIGIFLQVLPPKPTMEEQRSEARALLLAAGGLIGMVLILFGGFYFYLWNESVTNWLDKGEKKEMLFVVIPLLMVSVGAGLVFLSSQPARAEERNNPSLRRLVYGSNFAVTALLLFIFLAILNVVIGVKVQAKLDTTESGFYTLSDSTKNLLSKLPEKVTVYLMMPDSGDRLANDIRQFVYSLQDAGDGKVVVKFISPVTNKKELAVLQEKYPRIGRDEEGLLITAGEDEKRNAFVSLSDLFEMDMRSRRPKAFTGEAKVIKEIRFLSDNEQKAVVYFTQANGELSISSTGGADLAALAPPAAQLKSFLEKSYLDVRPLNFEKQNPKVPDDAAVVVVAEPQSPLPPASAEAIRKYMNEKKGKLIVLAGAAAGPNEKGMAKTGLEEVLAGFNVRLGEKFVYTAPTQDLPEFRVALAIFNPNLQNPISQTLAAQVRAIGLPMPREVSAVQGGNPQYTASSMLYSAPGRYTWLEDNRITPGDLDTILTDLEGNEAIRTRKALSRNPRSLAVVVSEGGAPNPHGGPPAAGAGRLVVIGSSSIFTDKAADRSTGGSSPISFDMMTLAVDWLRDRPSLPTSIEGKNYQMYTFPEPAAVDGFRLQWLPLGLAMLIVVGLGTGVWVMRRK